MSYKRTNPITYCSSIVAFFTIAYPNIQEYKYSWWFIIPGVFLFILIFGAHTGTIVYNYLISFKKYNNKTSRLLILLGILCSIILIGLLIFHHLYQ